MFLATISLLLISALRTHAQDTNSKAWIEWTQMSSKERFFWLRFTTPAYEKEALRLVIEDANRIAQELRLPEKLPITESNLLETFIGHPRFDLFEPGSCIGNITTSNYVYAPYSGKGISLVRTHLEREYGQLEAKYHWRLSRMDTNAAYQLATQWMAAVSMDVKALNRCPHIEINPWMPEGAKGYFVPLYRINWQVKAVPPIEDSAGNKYEWGSVASVELFLPTKTLRQMHVEDSKYILRKPAVVTNVDFLLSQTNAPAMTNAPIKQ